MEERSAMARIIAEHGKGTPVTIHVDWEAYERRMEKAMAPHLEASRKYQAALAATAHSIPFG